MGTADEMMKGGDVDMNKVIPMPLTSLKAKSMALLVICMAMNIGNAFGNRERGTHPPKTRRR